MMKKHILSSFLFLFIFFACEKETGKNIESITLNETTEIACKSWLLLPDHINRIYFDSVLYDSRCPIELLCFWGGEACVRFRIIEKNGTVSCVDLKVNTVDSLIMGYKFSVIDLLPYPSVDNETTPGDYKAKIIVK